MAYLDDEGREVEEDPRHARIVRRMRLFVGISTAIMALGFALVISVIVWRLVNRNEEAAAPTAVETGQPAHIAGDLGLEPGSRIAGATSDGQRLFLTVEAADGRQSIRIYDAATLQFRGRADAFAP
jgi:hypothetical protein